LAMSLSCAFTTSLTLAASAYDIFGIFGLTAKQPLLSTETLRQHFVFKSYRAFLTIITDPCSEPNSGQAIV
jgi:hypothetical protein